MQRANKGFTLLEILLVIAAIGILAAIVLIAINPNKQIEAAREAKRKSDQNAIAKAIQQYIIEKGVYPPKLQEVGVGGTVGLCVVAGCSDGIDLSSALSDYISSIPIPDRGQYLVTKTANGVSTGYDNSNIWATAGSIEPTLDLNFARDKQLTNAVTGTNPITFTRGSIGTYTGSDGLLKTAVANEPRFDHNPVTRESLGLLVEEQRTNFMLNSGGISPNTILGTGSVIGPDGVNCRTLIPNAGSHSFPGIGGPLQSFTISAGQTIDYAFSGWVAAGPTGAGPLEPRFVFGITVNGNTSPVYAELQINTSNMTVRSKSAGPGITDVSAPTVTLYSPGLYRFTWVIRYTQDATGRNTIGAGIQLRTTGGIGTYIADGVSGVQYALLQAEVGSAVSSTIPTTTAAATRSADVASITGTNLSSWYNQPAGSVYAEFSPAFQGSASATFGNPGVWGATQNSLGSFNGYGIRLVPNSPFNDSINGISRYAPGAFNNQVSIGLGAYLNTGQNYKTMFAWEGSGIAGSSQGQTAITNTNPAASAMGTHDQFYLGRQNVGGTPTQLNGHIRRLTYWKTRLSNTTLQSLTQ